MLSRKKRNSVAVCSIKSKGAMLPFFAVILVTMVAFLGISIYMGLTSYLNTEMEKASVTASLAGARLLFPGFDESGVPVPSPSMGQEEARRVVDTAIANVPFLQASSATASVAVNMGDQSVSVAMEGEFPTEFLSVVGINSIHIETTSRARALKYNMTSEGPIVLNPTGADPATFEALLPSDFPILEMTAVGGGEFEVFASQSPPFKGYSIELCTNDGCYLAQEPALVKITPIPPGQPAGPVVYGSALIDLSTAGINKASRIRITDDNYFDSFNGASHLLDSNPTVIEELFILGFSALCPASGCSNVVPLGLEPVL